MLCFLGWFSGRAVNQKFAEIIRCNGEMFLAFRFLSTLHPAIRLDRFKCLLNLRQLFGGLTCECSNFLFNIIAIKPSLPRAPCLAIDSFLQNVRLPQSHLCCVVIAEE